MLHDILEDTDCTEDILIQEVGKDVTKFVVALTKREGEAYEDYIHRVREFHYSKEVKIHDTLCNLTESIKSDSAYRVKKYANQLKVLVE
jgi:(p)ppGpp synthase/HD superfamily hydrolase